MKRQSIIPLSASGPGTSSPGESCGGRSEGEVGFRRSEKLQPSIRYVVCNKGEIETVGSTWNSPRKSMRCDAVVAGTVGDSREAGSCPATGEDDVRWKAEDYRDWETSVGRVTSGGMGEACLES